MKCWAGWSTSWNQDCQKNYQSPQICRWHHAYGRKWRRTKDPLDEIERGEWKSRLNTKHSENEDHGIQSHHFMLMDGETMETVRDFIFLGSKITIDDDCRREIKTLVSWRKSYDQPRQHIKKQRHYFANKGPSSQSYGLSSSHVQMWELNHKKGRAQKNWCFWTVILEKNQESLGLQEDHISQS